MYETKYNTYAHVYEMRNEEKNHWNKNSIADLYAIAV